MDILRFLEGLRTPALDRFFALVTHLGEETLFIVAGLVFFWCVSKKQGYYLLSVGFLGLVCNQFLKLLFRIPRPWVRDESFTIVESARAEATGYSFPSGHTQSAVGVFGSIARINRRVWVRILCIIACVLVPVSRMWLGVHTPADVGVSIVIALLLVFCLYPLVNKAFDRPLTTRLFFGGMVLVAVAYLAFVHLYPFPADTDYANWAHGVKNAFKILGCVLGLWGAYEIDNRYIHFDTKAVWWAQLIKLVLGLIPLLLIKSVLKEPLYALFDGGYAADAVRYALITLYAGCVWPLTFRLFAKLGKS